MRRNRHIPRICRDCRAPMASDQDDCWRCDSRWSTEPAPSTALRVLSVPPTHVDIDRWVDEGGSGPGPPGYRRQNAPMTV